ncbi:MAG: ParB/Srx family N-terminal domain-containing protein [Bacteroidia bacterium]
MQPTDDNKDYTELTVEDLEIFLKTDNHEYFTTHSKVCFEIIRRIHRRVLLGYDFGAIKVNGNRLIIDGNHRYLAYKLAGINY